jgi:hypothetical protein
MILVLGACGAYPGPDEGPGELQALLHDDPLVRLTSVASSAPTSTKRPAITQPPTFIPRGHWTFDGCEPDRTDLFNASSMDNTAYRSVGVTCAPGALGQGVAISAKEDIVYVPDQPYFAFDGGLTVAGWFQPTDLDRTQTLFRKRDKGTSAFALVLHRGRFRFVVNLGDGRAASVASPSPARPGVFQHVAASYDRLALRLYIDGQQVAVREVAGTIPPGPGPLVMGNDGSERRFDGVLDEAVFDLRALTAEEVLQLTCVPSTPSVVATPAVSAPTSPDVPVTFDIAVTNQNPPACVPMDFVLTALDPPPNIILDAAPVILQSPPVASGATTHFTITATPFDSVETGAVPIDFDVFSINWDFGFSGSVDIVVSEPVGCHVSKSRELLINDPSVVADPIRALSGGPAGDPRAGVWSFKHLVEGMASTPADAPALVEDMLRSYTTPQVINGFIVAPRPNMSVLDTWPRTPDGRLDLSRAPLRLQAIVSRLDLRELARGDAGQANFIFGFIEPDGFLLQATLMFEYKLPAATEADVLAWAQVFHALGASPFSESYNTALQAITDRIVRRGARPGGINGSALHVVRSNEFPFGDDFSWQLREFALSPATGRLVPAALELTPDLSFNGTSALAGFITANRDSIIAGTHIVPDQLDGQPFRAGAVTNDESTTWVASGVDPEARRDFALSTCNGCHSPQETGTFFQHVSIFGTGTAALSPFLRGTTIGDPVTGEPRTFNDLRRRAEDLASIVCPAVTSRGGAAMPRASLRHGIRRVH